MPYVFVLAGGGKCDRGYVNGQAACC
jgi:hypothetical protein